MKRIINSLFVAALSFFSLSSYAVEFKEGIDYAKVENVDPALNNKVIEIFSYHCHYCYRAQKSVHDFVEKMSEGMTLEHVPVTFGYTQLDPYANTFFIMNELGLTEQLHDYAFQVAKMPIKGEKQFNNLANMEGVKAFFSDNGVSDAEYESALSKVKEKELIKKNNQFASKYHVEGTPTYIINGKYVVADYKKGPSYDRYFTELLLYISNLKD